jgi:hypothetical protein
MISTSGVVGGYGERAAADRQAGDRFVGADVERAAVDNGIPAVYGISWYTVSQPYAC